MTPRLWRVVVVATSWAEPVPKWLLPMKPDMAEDMGTWEVTACHDGLKRTLTYLSDEMHSPGNRKSSCLTLNDYPFITESLRV
ncbi:unnamed protein product [Protopolystoma xenopodis]|uniref:Uncharacterized protein n=1 Tax=Protopolystoma xenopodis TaxID=117903 RepID=A0A448WFW2_9PLAT|nr:unnamed protein product [Protopolystoma xenopodis]